MDGCAWIAWNAVCLSPGMVSESEDEDQLAPWLLVAPTGIDQYQVTSNRTRCRSHVATL